MNARREPASKLRTAWRWIRIPNGRLIAALIAITAALAYSIDTETPTGSLHGRVYLADSGREIGGARVYLTSTNESDPRRFHRRATSDANGRFTLSNIPAGSYQVSAHTDSHDTSGTATSIDEGRATSIEIEMRRTNSALELSQHQRTYSTSEAARLGVHGYVDPKKPRGTDTLQLSLYKSRLSSLLKDAETAMALEKAGRSWDSPPGLPSELLKPKKTEAPALIERRDVKLNKEDREGYFNQRIEFGNLAPGVYLVDIAHKDSAPPAAQSESRDKVAPADGVQKICAWMLVTDTALVVKKARGQVLAYAVDMKTGTPLPGSSIKAYKGGKVLAQATADANGLAEMKVGYKKRPKHSGDGAEASSDGEPEGDSGESDAPDVNDSRLMIVAERGQDEAVVRQNDFQYEEDGAFTVHAYTDRPVYRPGQRISYKGIVRRNLEPGSRYTVPAGESVAVEVRDPDGDRLVRETKNANRYGSFFGAFTLNAEAPTGVYSLITTVKGEKHTEDIVVASYKKPEFQVTVKADKKRYSRGEDAVMTITGEYYFGTPLAGAKVRYSIFSSPDWASEYDYGDEEKPDPEDEDAGPNRWGHGEHYYGQEVTQGDAILDESGKAIIHFKADIPNEPDAPQAQVFTLTATVTDDAKREVESQGEARVTAGDFRLTVSPEGYLAEPGKPASVIVMAKDFDGKPIAGHQVTLKATYQKWVKDKYQEIRISEQPATTGPDGKAILQIVPPKAGDVRLVALAQDSQNRLIKGHGYLWAAGDEGGDLDTEYADLSLATDKRKYNPGETARVLINSARFGQTVLLTVEGSRVYRSFTVPMKNKSAVARVPVLADYGPNVFLSACYVRDKRFAETKATLRVANPAREIVVSIEPDRKAGGERGRGGDGETRATATPQLPNNPITQLPRYSPADKISYRIRTTDRQGKPAPCEISFGVVDEAIYAIREDDPKALKNAFYPRRHNSVRTSYSFAIEYLGDADKAEPKITARRKFEDTAHWDPSVQTDSQGLATVSFQLPENLTTWRATATAATLDTALGRSTNKVLVAKDFFVRVETPRFMTQNDSSKIVALVHNDTGIRQTALVKIRTQNLPFDGGDTRTLTVEPGLAADASWTVSAREFGNAEVTITAWTPKVTGAKQYTDGAVATFPIRPHGRELFAGFAGELTAEKPENEVIRLDATAIPGVSRMTVRITPSIPGATLGALEYLVGYPYGCTEQTMSRFLPDILVQRVLGTNGITLSPKLTRELPGMVKNGLQRLGRFQHQTGGWGWWEYDQDDAFMTAYVLYGLANARQAGYPVSDRMLKRGLEAAKKMADKGTDNNQAFVLYSIALAGDNGAARTRRKTIDLKKATPETVTYAILLNKLVGEPDTPADLMTPALTGQLMKYAVTESSTLHWKFDDKSYGYDWDSKLYTAAGLRALIAMDPKDPKISMVIRWLMANRTGEYWSSTRDTSWVLAALVDYLASRPQETATGEVRVKVNGALLRTYQLTPEMLREPEIVLQVPSTALRAGKNDVTLERAGGNSTVFYSVQLRQTVRAEDMASAGPPGYSVKREYFRVLPRRSGTDSWALQTEPTGNRFQVGDHVRVRLTITAPKDMGYVLIEDQFPAGCETTERGTAGEEHVYNRDWGFWWEHVDVRDDRIAFFARSMPKGEHTIEYNLRAQTSGANHVLPTVVEAMYSPEQHVESSEARVVVK